MENFTHLYSCVVDLDYTFIIDSINVVKLVIKFRYKIPI